MVQGYKHCQSPVPWPGQLRTDIHHLRGSPVGLSQSALPGLPPMDFTWHHTLPLCGFFPLPFVLVLFLYFPTVFSLIHMSAHQGNGTYYKTRLTSSDVLRQLRARWPWQLSACACMNLGVFPMAWMDCYSFTFHWIKHLWTIWRWNMHPDCCLKIFC